MNKPEQPRDVIYLAAALVGQNMHVIDALNAAAIKSDRWSYCTPYLREQIPCKDIGEWAARTDQDIIRSVMLSIADNMGELTY